MQTQKSVHKPFRAHRRARESPFAFAFNMKTTLTGYTHATTNTNSIAQKPTFYPFGVPFLVRAPKGSPFISRSPRPTEETHRHAQTRLNSLRPGLLAWQGDRIQPVEASKNSPGVAAVVCFLVAPWFRFASEQMDYILRSRWLVFPSCFLRRGSVCISEVDCGRTWATLDSSKTGRGGRPPAASVMRLTSEMVSYTVAGEYLTHWRYSEKGEEFHILRRIRSKAKSYACLILTQFMVTKTTSAALGIKRNVV